MRRSRAFRHRAASPGPCRRLDRGGGEPRPRPSRRLDGGGGGEDASQEQ